jgi:dTDP-4-amino-4,6-dideoxygalactose transaminase
MPAWTFVASAAAARAANLVPHFVDVAADTWALDPAALRSRADLQELGAVLVVGPFGAPVETAPWEAFSAETGIPVVIDSAAGFDAVASVTAARPGTSAVMISLHATKAFAAGEGAIVLSTDEPLMRRVRRASNFGIGGRSSASLAGFNGKMSEYHAAVGHAALDEWPQRRSALRSRARRYAGELARVPHVSSLPGFGSTWISTNCAVRLPCAAEPVVERLRRIGIEARRWWGDGVHRHRAYRDAPCDSLAVTEDLARHVISLPFSFDMSDAEIACVAEGIAGAVPATPRNAAI